MNGKQAKRLRQQSKLLMIRTFGAIAQRDIPEQEKADTVNKLPSVRQLYRKLKRAYVLSTH